MTKGIPDGQSLLGVAINSKNTGVGGDSNATSNEIKLCLVCVCSFFRADFTAMKLVNKLCQTLMCFIFT